MPTLTSLLLPNTDVGAGNRTLTFTAGATDMSGVDYVYIVLDRAYRSNGQDLDTITFSNALDSFSDGTSSRSYQIDSASAAGTYTIVSLYVYDLNGNYTEYATADLISLGFDTDFIISKDTVLPTLSALTLPDVNVTGGNQVINFAAFASDADSGVESVILTLDKPLSSGGASRSTLFFSDANDSYGDGSSAFSYQIDASTASGTYNITSAVVRDKAGNAKTYTTSELAGLGIDTSFQVTSNVAPAVTAIAAGPVSVREGDNGTFQISVTLKNVGVLSGTIAYAYEAGSATATNGGDVTVNAGSQPFSFNNGAPQDVVVNLPAFTIIDDALAEGSETIAVRITIPGQTFANGTDSFVVSVPLLSNDFVGTPGSDSLTGTATVDNLIGGGGNDFLDGAGGVDRMAGGIGNDWFWVDAAADQVLEAVGEGYDRVLASASYTLSSTAEVELMIATGTVAMNLTGNGIGQYLIGNAFDNVLDGKGGIDTTDGGAGNDTHHVDNAFDWIVERAGEGNDTVVTTTDYRLSSSAEIETLTAASGAGALTLYGNDLANTINGNASSNTLYGFGGNDELVGNGGNDIFDGGAGADTMRGGTGNDHYVVDNAGDVIIDNSGTGYDRVYAFVSYRAVSGFANVELIMAADPNGTDAIDLAGESAGLRSNTILGNQGANVLEGGGGFDTLEGYGGDDTLDGGSERDTLIGGGGADTFRFSDTLRPNEWDTIADFATGVDKIALDDARFLGMSPGALPTSAFVVGTAAQDADDRIVYDPATGFLYFDRDGAGGLAQQVFANIGAGTTIAAGDFLVI